MRGYYTISYGLGLIGISATRSARGQQSSITYRKDCSYLGDHASSGTSYRVGRVSARCRFLRLQGGLFRFALVPFVRFSGSTGGYLVMGLFALFSCGVTFFGVELYGLYMGVYCLFVIGEGATLLGGSSTLAI